MSVVLAVHYQIRQFGGLTTYPSGTMENSSALRLCQQHLHNWRSKKMISAMLQGHAPGAADHARSKGTRKVVEHVALFKMQTDFSEKQEKDMLDHLYTLQYQIRGIIAVSLGPIDNDNSEACTHALFVRFPTAQALKEYYDHPARLKIADDYIRPYYNGLICVDYEAEVKDDIVPIFRKGEEFERGIERVVFLCVKEGINLEMVQNAFESLDELIQDLGSLVVQHTSGPNFSSLSKGYTHGMVTRFPSVEAMTIFTEHSSYIKIMENKFVPVTSKILSINFLIQPSGTTVL